MGALIAKPSQGDHRIWDLRPHQAVSYFEFTSDPRIVVYTFARRAVRVLSGFGWISDGTRYSYDGWYRQRLVDCYVEGSKTDWAAGLSLLSQSVLDRPVAFHWGSTEREAFYSVYRFLESCASAVYLPYSITSSLTLRNITSLEENSHNIQTRFALGWSPREVAPTLNDNLLSSFIEHSLVTPAELLANRGYIGLQDRQVSTESVVHSAPTSYQETETTNFAGGFNRGDAPNLKEDQACTCVFLQTEAVSTENPSVYLGTHGFVSASTAVGVLPVLLPYERSSPFLGRAFLRGPSAARTAEEVTSTLLQIYSFSSDNGSQKDRSRYLYKLISGEGRYNLYREVFVLDRLAQQEQLDQRWLLFYNLSPEFAVSELQQCIYNRYSTL